MKNLVFIISLLLIITSCGSGGADDRDAFDAVSERFKEGVRKTREIQNKLAGSYVGCEDAGGGYYQGISITVSEDDFSYVLTLSANADCSVPYYEDTNSFSIQKAEYKDGSSTEIEIDMKIVAKSFNPLLAFYVGQNYCGDTTWVLGTAKNITGLSCPAYLAGDSFHSEIRDAGITIYYIMNTTDTTLGIPVTGAESGDSDAERYESDIATGTKI